MLRLQAQTDIHLAGLGMTGDVGEGFLGDAEEGGGPAVVQGNVVPGQQVAGDAGALAEFFGEPFQGRQDAQVEHRRTQLGGHLAHHPHRLLHQVLHGVQALADGRRGVAQLPSQQGQVHFQGGQQGALLIVDLPGDALALLLHGGFAVGGQVPQLLPGFEQFLGHAAAFGDLLAEVPVGHFQFRRALLHPQFQGAAQGPQGQVGGDPGLHFLALDGLADVVHAAAGKGLDAVLHGAGGTDENHRDVPGGRIGLELGAQLQPAHVGHADVQQHQVRLQAVEGGQGLGPVGHGVHRVAVALQQLGEQMAVQGGIVRQQDGAGDAVVESRRHGSLPVCGPGGRFLCRPF